MKELITVIVPTYNAGNEFTNFCKILQKQTANIKEVIVVDSSSTDDTVRIAQDAGFTVKVIDDSEHSTSPGSNTNSKKVYDKPVPIDVQRIKEKKDFLQISENSSIVSKEKEEL